MNPRLVAVSAATIIAGAALAGTMFGIVKDDKGDPIANAEVKVFGKDDLKTTTDVNGKFKIESKDLLDGNKYSVAVSAANYNEINTISVEMFDDPKDMDPIEITLSKSEPVISSWTNTVDETNTTLIPYTAGGVGMRRPNLNTKPNEVKPANATSNTTAAGSTATPAPSATNEPPSSAKPGK